MNEDQDKAVAIIKYLGEQGITPEQLKSAIENIDKPEVEPGRPSDPKPETWTPAWLAACDDITIRLRGFTVANPAERSTVCPPGQSVEMPLYEMQAAVQEVLNAQGGKFEPVRVFPSADPETQAINPKLMQHYAFIKLEQGETVRSAYAERTPVLTFRYLFPMNYADDTARKIAEVLCDALRREFLNPK